MKKLLLFAFCALISSISFAQIEYLERFEIELKDDYENEEVHQFGEDGVILVANSKKSRKGNREWKIDHYSTQLTLIQSLSFEVPKKYQTQLTRTRDNHVQILLTNHRGKYGLLNIQLVNGKVQIELTEFKLGKKNAVTNMVVTEKITFLGVSANRITGGKKFIVQVNNKTGQTKVTPLVIEGAKSKSLSIGSISEDNITGNIIYHISEAKKKRIGNSYFMVYSPNGDKIDEFKIDDGSGNIIDDLSSSQLSENKRVITGTYKLTNSESSIGLFFGQMDGTNVEFIKYYPFTDFENFLSYLPERTQERIAKKKKRKEKRGKSFNLNYRLASHGIIEINDEKGGYLYLGEAYYPTYRTETYTTTDANGNTVTRTRTVFDGYKYTHAVLARFDQEGNLIWDHIFEFEISYKPFQVKRFITVAEGLQDGIKLTYSSNFKIYNKAFDFNGTIKTDTQSETIDFGEGTKVKRSFNDVHHWYKNFYLVSGIQVIKEEGKLKKRKVFFMNKLRVN